MTKKNKAGVFMGLFALIIPLLLIVMVKLNKQNDLGNIIIKRMTEFYFTILPIIGFMIFLLISAKIYKYRQKVKVK